MNQRAWVSIRPIIVLLNGEAAPSNSMALASDSNSTPNCGLGAELMRAGRWQFLTGWKA